MKSMPCPTCGTVLDLTGRVPGSTVTCACGNVVTVPREGVNRKVIYIVLGIAFLVLLCPCMGVITAIAVPNFIKFQARSKQAECKVNLKAWYTTEYAYFADQNTYNLTASKIGFLPERGNRYAYFSGPGPVEDRSSAQAENSEQAENFGSDTARHPGKAITFEQLPPEVASRVGISGECPECEITLACAGQIDKDGTLDVWTISSADRTLADGTTLHKGTPYNEVNDVNE
jgi:type IV pilus assembly protein PilA